MHSISHDSLAMTQNTSSEFQDRQKDIQNQADPGDPPDLAVALVGGKMVVVMCSSHRLLAYLLTELRSRIAQGQLYLCFGADRSGWMRIH